MNPALSVLQLDTGFPRIPGDVASPETYTAPVEMLRVSGAGVAEVVRANGLGVDIAPFETALAEARGEIVVTSCGFLAPWQGHLQGLTTRPVIASALTALPRLLHHLAPETVLILTYDATRLGPAHLGGQGACLSDVVGLPPDMALRQAIAHDRDFSPDRAAEDISTLVRHRLRPRHRHILLECTNLPPYGPRLQAETGLPVSSILTEIARVCPGLVRDPFLTDAGDAM